MTYLSLDEFIQRGGKVEISGGREFDFVFPDGYRYHACTDSLSDGLQRVERWLLTLAYEEHFGDGHRE